MTKASVAFVVSTALDVHVKCCISGDAKIQASIEHETEVKPIHRKTWLHSSLPCSFRCTWRTHLSAINRQVFVVQLVVVVFQIRAPGFGHRAHKFLVVIGLVVVQDSVVKWKLTTFVFSCRSFDLPENAWKEVIRTTATVNLWPPLFTFGVSRKSWELINFNATCTSKLDLQRIQVLKEAFCHYLEGQQTNVNGRRRIFTEWLWHER